MAAICLGLFLGLSLGLATPAFAQRGDRENRESIDTLLDHLRVHLDQHERELAEEYLDIVEQLRDIIEDYESELADLRQITNESHDVSLERLRRGLEKGRYVDDAQQLMDDIDDLVQQLKGIESEQKAIENTNRPRTTRVVRNLRRQLVMMVDLIEDYTDSSVRSIFKQKEMKEYLELAMRGVAQAMRMVGDSLGASLRGMQDMDIAVPRIPTMEPVIIETGEDSDAYVFVVPDRSVLKGWQRGGDEVGTIRQWQDSLVADRSLISQIANPLGGVSVVGWDEEMITAELTVEVASTTRSREKELLREIDLSMEESGGVYRVRAVYPSIRNADTKVINSRLKVYVPEDIEVDCSSSFGVVTVSDLRNGLTVHSQHSEVTVDNITGRTEVTGSMAPMAISEIDGPLEARNSYAQLVIYGCEGDITAENAYSLVKLTDTRGTVSVRNSGETKIHDHEGTVTVENTYGIVNVSDVEGSVTVSNSYSPVTLSTIYGSVNVRNAYSHIEASEVEGDISATSSHGLIRVVESKGPIDVISQNGSVELVLYGPMSGLSRVVANHGKVDVRLESHLDLRLTAETTNGNIVSDVPGSEIANRGGITQSAELLFGDGSARLDLKGEGTHIFIAEY